jgi:hypothetical protein
MRKAYQPTSIHGNKNKGTWAMTPIESETNRLKSAYSVFNTPTPILLALLFVGLPLVLTPFDFWDGRILFHALETEQNIGVRHWFFTSGWIIQYYIFSAVQSIEGITGPIGLFLFRVIMIASVCGVVYEALRFNKTVARLPHGWALVAATTVAVFPAWNALLSSVTFIYVLCTWLVLLAIRLIHKSQSHYIAGGIILLLVSFQLNSNFVFSIALGMAYVTSAYVHDRASKRGHVLRFIAILLTSIFGYVALNLLFTESDLYAEYNHFQAIGSANDILTFFVEMIRYYQYVIVLAFILIATHLTLASLKKRESTSTQGDFKSVLWPVALSLFLIGCAAFPYVVVGKPADLRAVMVEWNPRHTFLMAMPIGLFLASFAQFLCRWHNLGSSKRCFLPAACAIIFMALFLQASFWHKISRAAYEAGIINALKQQTPPPTGFVKIITTHLPIARIRYYESNWVLYKAYDEERWFSGMVLSDDQAMYIPSWISSDELLSKENKLKHIMTNFQGDCESVIKIEGDTFTFFEVISWAILNSPLPDTLSASLESSSCTP